MKNELYNKKISIALHECFLSQIKALLDNGISQDVLNILFRKYELITNEYSIIFSEENINLFLVVDRQSQSLTEQLTILNPKMAHMIKTKMSSGWKNFIEKRYEGFTGFNKEPSILLGVTKTSAGMDLSIEEAIAIAAFSGNTPGPIFAKKNTVLSNHSDAVLRLNFGVNGHEIDRVPYVENNNQYTYLKKI